MPPPAKGFSSNTHHSCNTLRTVYLSAASSLPGGRGLCPHPSSLAAPGIPQPGRGTAATLTAAEGPGTSLSSVSRSPLCNGTAGFLGGAAEDSVSRVPRHSLPQTSPWALDAHRVGSRTGSHAFSEATPPKPRLQEATPPGNPTVPGSAERQDVGSSRAWDPWDLASLVLRLGCGQWGESGWSEPSYRGPGWQNTKSQATEVGSGKSGPESPGWSGPRKAVS